MTRTDRGRARNVVLCCFLVLLGVPSVHAQERAGEVLKQFERQEPAPKARTVPPAIEVDTEKDRQKQRRITPEDSTPIFIKGIVVKDDRRLLTADEIGVITRSQEGKQQPLAELLAVADRLTALLRSKGYITSYAFIPPQEVKNGLLSIEIMAGGLGAVTVAGNQSYHAGFIRGHLEKFRSDGVLNESGLMRQMLILNEHPSLEARAALKAGTAAGTSDINLAVRDKRPIFGSLSYDNFGNGNISRDRISVVLGAGNLALDGDTLSLFGTTGLRKLDIDTLAYGRIEYLAPVNYSGTRLGGYYANSLYRADGDIATLDLNGKADVAGLYVTHPLVRQAADSLTFKLGFDYKDVSDYMLGGLNSRDSIRTLTTELSYDGVDRLAGRNLLSAGWVMGLRGGLGGAGGPDPKSSRQNATGDFHRLTLDAARYQNLGGQHRLVLKAGGQYSDDELFVAEQYQIGGAYSVRGYRPSFRSGDSGYTASAELYFALLQPAVSGVSGGFLPQLGTLSLFLVPFVDHGGVYRNDPQAGESHEAHLTSVGTGLRIGSGGLSARVDWAVPERGGWRLGDSMTTVQVTAAF